MTMKWDEYDHREIDLWLREMRQIDRAPLADRQENARAFLDDLREPSLVAERVGWLLDGNYGRGAYLKAHQVLGSPRMNRPAALVGMVGASEWHVPMRAVSTVWKKLTIPQKEHLRRAIEQVIREAESERGRDPGRRRRR